MTGAVCALVAPLANPFPGKAKEESSSSQVSLNSPDSRSHYCRPLRDLVARVWSRARAVAALFHDQTDNIPPESAYLAQVPLVVCLAGFPTLHDETAHGKPAAAGNSPTFAESAEFCLVAASAAPAISNATTPSCAFPRSHREVEGLFREAHVAIVSYYRLDDACEAVQMALQLPHPLTLRHSQSLAGWHRRGVALSAGLRVATQRRRSDCAFLHSEVTVPRVGG